MTVTSTRSISPAEVFVPAEKSPFSPGAKSRTPIPLKADATILSCLSKNIAITDTHSAFVLPVFTTVPVTFLMYEDPGSSSSVTFCKLKSV